MGHEGVVPLTLWGVIPVYGLLAAIGFALALCWTYVEWIRKGKRHWDFVQVVSLTTVAALYGAKLWYIVFSPVEFFSQINSFLEFLISVFIPATGRSIIGTVVFAPIAIYVISLYNPDVKFRETIDIILPAILIGQFVARWGNFANHSVYGLEVSGDSLNWLPTWIKDNMLIYDHNGLESSAVYRNPVFLYESIADLLIFLFITTFIKNFKWLNDGSAGASYIMLYGLFRAIFEPMRDPQFIMHWGPIPTSLIAALVLFVVGIGMLIHFNPIHLRSNSKVL